MPRKVPPPFQASPYGVELKASGCRDIADACLAWLATQACSRPQVPKEVRDGQTKAVIVAGDPGIGKTRLVAEFCVSAHSRGAAILVGLWVWYKRRD